MGAFVQGLPRPGDDLCHGFQGIDRGVGAGMGRLGAEGAVFRTAPRLGVDDGAEFDLVAEVLFAQTMGAGKNAGQFGPAGAENGQALGIARRLAGQDLCRNWSISLIDRLTMALPLK